MSSSPPGGLLSPLAAPDAMGKEAGSHGTGFVPWAFPGPQGYESVS